MKALSGKFVIRDDGQSYRTGQIMAVLDTAVLIQFDLMNTRKGDPPGFTFPMELIGIEQLTQRLNDDVPAWGFFDSRDRLNSYLEWLDGAGPPGTVTRLVHSRKKDDDRP